MTEQSQDNSAEPIISLIEIRERELLDLKRAVNLIYRAAGKEPKYSDIDTASSTSTSGPLVRGIRTDQFYRRPLASAVREILEIRGQASSVDEIASALETGGFHFDWKEEFKLKNLAISLSKNPVFHRLPNGKFGLAKKYDLEREERPAKKQRRKKKSKRSRAGVSPGPTAERG